MLDLLTKRNILLIAGALCLVYGYQCDHGLPNRAVTWAPDGDPLMPLVFAKRVLMEGWNTGWHSPYPDFHRIVLLCFYTPYMGVRYLQGDLSGIDMEAGYPFGLESFDSIFHHLGIITRVVSILMAVGSLYFIARTCRALFPDRSPGLGALILAFSPPYFYYVHTETLDLPMLFWLSAAIYSYVRVLQTFQTRYYVWLAILAAVSTATKDYAYGLFVLMPLPLVWELSRTMDGPPARRVLRSIVDRRHVIAIGVFALAFILAENMLWNPSGFVNHVKLAAGVSDNPTIITTEVRYDFVSLARLDQLRRVMIFVLGWVGLPVCLLGMLLAAAKAPRILVWFVCPMVSFYIFTVVPGRPAVGTGADIERTFMPLALPLAIFGGYFLDTLWTTAKQQNAARLFAAVALLAMAGNGLALKAMLIDDTRYATEEWIAANVDKSATVEVYGYRGTCPRLFDSCNEQIVNQDETPVESDIRITNAESPLAGLAERSPAVVVVVEPYARTWWYKHKDDELAPGFREFFDQLREEKAGYRRVQQFEPRFGGIFGMPDQRRLVPAISVYERISGTNDQG